MVINRQNLSVVCVGSNIESLVCLRKFKDNNIHIAGLVTLEFQQQRRGSDYRDLVPFCIENDISFFRTKNINSIQTKGWLKSFNPDVIFILGWSQILDLELIDLPKKYIIGSHPSDLPYGAGRAPVVWTILEELKKSAVSFFKISNEVDAGNLVLQKHFHIPERSDSTLLYNLVAMNLSEGFRGRPNIGAAAMLATAANENDPFWSQIHKAIDAAKKVVTKKVVAKNVDDVAANVAAVAARKAAVRARALRLKKFKKTKKQNAKTKRFNKLRGKYASGFSGQGYDTNLLGVINKLDSFKG